jgi:hypothetical protein
MTTDNFAVLFNNPSRRMDYLKYLSKAPPSEQLISELHKKIINSEPVRQLLTQKDDHGETKMRPYQKWNGAHWVLTSLADLHYPPGDPALLPLADQVIGYLLGKLRADELKRRNRHNTTGRYRACASIEGNALFAFIRLGLRNDVIPRLAESLLSWQWPDGGWNCDVRAEASHSSFYETLIPMRALALYGIMSGDRKSTLAAEKASEVFLKHQLYKTISDGTPIDPRFLKLHYPIYWHYDILAGLWGMVDIDRLDDPRCKPAKEMLINKQLPDGGFAAEEKFYHHRSGISNYSTVDWGPVSKQRMNPWVTIRAMCVLQMDQAISS